MAAEKNVGAMTKQQILQALGRQSPSGWKSADCMMKPLSLMNQRPPRLGSQLVSLYDQNLPPHPTTSTQVPKPSVYIVHHDRRHTPRPKWATTERLHQPRGMVVCCAGVRQDLPAPTVKNAMNRYAVHRVRR